MAKVIRICYTDDGRRCDKREEVGEIETETKVTNADGMVVAEISEGSISSFSKAVCTYKYPQ